MHRSSKLATCITRRKTWNIPDLLMGTAVSGAMLAFFSRQLKSEDVYADSRVPKPLIRAHMMQEKDFASFQKEYDFIEEIGSGGFAEIWKVRHKLTGFVRAAKVVKLNSDREYRFFRNEVDVLKKLDSPYNVRIVDSFCSRDGSKLGQHWQPRRGVIVYHYIKGKDLLDTINQRIAAKQKFTEPEIVSITKQILKGLCYVHKCGFLHRDIKPENFIVEVDDSPCGFNLKLIDFGLSRSSALAINPNERTSGTWFYSAPETANNAYTDKSDVWSAGVIITMLASQGTALIGRSTSMGVAGVKRIRDPDFVFTEIDKLSRRGISSPMVGLLKKMLDPDVNTRISPIEALNDSALATTLSREHAEDDGIDRWRRNREAYALAPLFARYMRRLFVHQIDDSELSRLRFLFRILDKGANGYVTVSGLHDEERYGYEEFLAVGLEKEDIKTHLGSFFRYVSDRSGVVTVEELGRIFPGLERDFLQEIMQSCRPGEKSNLAIAMNLNDFERCMNSEMT